MDDREAPNKNATDPACVLGLRSECEVVACAKSAYVQIGWE